MTPDHFLTRIITPAITDLATMNGPTLSVSAQRFMLAIAMQESGPALQARYQNSPSATPGPARGFWQFEQAGGVAGVLLHRASANLALDVCDRYSVQPQPPAVWRALEGHDYLAACFARLLILTLPQPLPETGHEAWRQYLDAWRPGKPHPETWAENWAVAYKAAEARTSPLV